jgi:hypothetical protein
MSHPVLVGIHYRSRNQERACVHTSSAKIWAGKASQCRYADDESVCIMHAKEIIVLKIDIKAG